MKMDIGKTIIVTDEIGNILWELKIAKFEDTKNRLDEYLEKIIENLKTNGHGVYELEGDKQNDLQ